MPAPWSGQLNDEWRVISRTAVDYNGHRKPLCFAPARFLRSSPSLHSVRGLKGLLG